MTDLEKLQHLRREISTAIAHNEFMQTACEKVDKYLGIIVSQSTEVEQRIDFDRGKNSRPGRCSMRYLVLLLALCACNAEFTNSARLQSAPWITKGAVLYDDRCESTPVIWTDGSQLDIVWHRDASIGQVGVSFDIVKAGQVISNQPFVGGFISALVSGGSLYVFGSGTSEPGNEVFMTSSADLVTWSAPQIVLQAGPDEIAYNTSVAPDASGFVLASERCAVGDGCAHVAISFYHSTDLVNWSFVAGPAAPGSYEGAPAIRYSNGYYYLVYMGNAQSYYFVAIARSTDLKSWEYSRQTVLSPTDQIEGDNASDFDLVDEGTGVVKILYAIGYQTPGAGHYMDIREATYQGNMAEFFEEFFK
jgi:hypothetical protein